MSDPTPCARIKLPAAPLLRLLELQARARGVSVTEHLNGRDRQQYNRASLHGWIYEDKADRMAITHLGLGVEEIYGWELDKVAYVAPAEVAA